MDPTDKSPAHKSDNLTWYEPREGKEHAQWIVSAYRHGRYKEATTIAVMNSAGTLVMESIVETKAPRLCSFSKWAAGPAVCDVGRSGTWAAWLYDPLKPTVTKVVVQSAQERSAEGGQQE